MAAPFCTACGAAVAEGTRFCVKCGRPVGQAAAPPPPPPPPEFIETQPMVLAPPPPVPSPGAQPHVAPASVAPAVKKGSGAGIWIGIFGILLLLGGAGLWFYSMARHEVRHAASTVQVAEAPAPVPVQSAPARPEAAPPNPEPAPNDQAPAQPNPEPIPTRSNDSAPPASNPSPAPSAAPPPTAPSAPASPRPVKAAAPTSGVLHASVEVAQNGEVVFENLPGGRLRFTFDHDAWKPTISHQPNGTQTLVMRSLKPGMQTSCDVRWEIVQ